VSRLGTMVKEFDTHLQSFRKLLFEETRIRDPGITSARARRGLIDVMGYGLKYLFGTADARDVKRLTAACDKLHAFESRMRHAVDHQLTYIQILNEVTRQNAMDIADLTKTMRDSIRNFSLQLNRVEADLLDTQAALEKQARYSAAIREIDMAIVELKFSVIKLQGSLDATGMGQLSSVLNNPYNLSIILQ